MNISGIKDSLQVFFPKKLQSQEVGKREPLYTAGGNVNWCSHYGKKMEFPLKTKNRASI